MKLSLNKLIELTPDIHLAKTDEQRWNFAHKLLQEIGGSHIVISEIAKSNRQLLWARTSMKPEWMTEYLEQNYYDDDPIITEILLNPSATKVDCGTMGIAQKRDNPAIYNMNNGLKDVGYGTLASHSFDVRNGSASRFVTLCFEDANALDDPSRKSATIWLQNFMSLFLSETPHEKSIGLVTQMGAHSLSQREKDVLCYLAAGYKTASIADKLGIADITVSKHLANARKKTNTSTREQTIALAIASGAISL